MLMIVVSVISDLTFKLSLLYIIDNIFKQMKDSISKINVSSKNFS